MARKSNQHKNKVDRNSSNIKKRSSETDCSVPGGKGQTKASELKNILGEELLNGNQPGSNMSGGRIKTKSAGGDNKIRQASGNSISKDQQTSEEVQHVEQPVLSGSNPMDSFQETRTFGAGGENETLPEGNSDVKHVNGSVTDLLRGLHFKHMVEHVDNLHGGVIRSSKALAVSISKAIGEWLERQRPLIVTLRNNILNACDLIRSKIEFAYPSVLKWLMHFGSILLLLSMVWLDCAFRGIHSFLRMGTTAFFSVVWYSILSVIAMVGMLKFLFVLAIAALIGAFIGFSLGFLVLAIGGTAFLWVCGSFWTTTMIIAAGGLALLKHERLALFITSAYSVYCAWVYVGWLGLLLGLNLSFISSDALIFFLKSNIDQQRRAGQQFEQAAGMQGQPNFFDDENVSSCETGQGFSPDRGPGVASTSGSDSDMTSEDEVIRLLKCTDHYSTLGFSRYENVDVSILKREYRKKAMLVHPDKNMGNEKAAEAFKKLQNAYEVLLDSLKRKEYDDELRREELLKYFRRFQSMSQKNGGNGLFSSGFPRSEADGEDPFGDSRRISCKRCNNFHVWILTRKSKSRARWCQDCNDFHQVKDGDGWVEQSSRPFMFGLMQKVDAPSAYVCAESKIYDVTEWYICQGMRVPANAHKPSFHVNTSVASKQNASKGTSSGQRGSRMPNFNNVEENLTEEELYEWLQNAVQTGTFDNFSGSSSTESSFPKPASSSKGGGSAGSGGKRKKKGKKQW